jgi:hypothetical protein
VRDDTKSERSSTRFFVSPKNPTRSAVLTLSRADPVAGSSSVADQRAPRSVLLTFWRSNKAVAFRRGRACVVAPPGRRVTSPKRGIPWLSPRNVHIPRACAWSNRMGRSESTAAITASKPGRKRSFGATVSTLRVGDVRAGADAVSRAATTAHRADPQAARRRGTRARFPAAPGRCF